MRLIRTPLSLLCAFVALQALPLTTGLLPSTPEEGAQAAARPRVIVSTDIGGTDPDDLQSMVHFLLYADMFDVEGLVSSPYGAGPDGAHPSSHRPLRARLREPEDVLGAVSDAGRVAARHEARRARFRDRQRCGPAHGRVRLDRPRPRGGTIRARSGCWCGAGSTTSPRRCTTLPTSCRSSASTSSAGPNKMWSVDAYNYIEEHHPTLWIVEANATYRGWFTGGNQSGDWGNTAFVAAHVAGRGALGEFFATLLEGTIKMGDSPSVGYLLHGTPEDPSQPGWGGRFVARLGWTEDGLHSPDDRGGHRRSLRRRRVRAARARRHDARTLGADDLRRPHSRRRHERRPRAAVPLLAARRQGVAVRDPQ